MSAKSTVTVLGAVTVLLVAGVFVALPVLAQDGGDGVELPPKQEDGDYDCGQFTSREQVEAVYNPDNDQYRLDNNDPDKIACENVGEPTEEQPTEEPTEEPTDEQTTEQPTDDKQTEDKKEQTETTEEDKQKKEMKDEQKEEKQDKQMEEETDDEKQKMHDEKMDDTKEEQPPC